ncbi:MAG: deacetylase [Chloroflexi bacterium RBG_16_57_11]|nr:MAG: deacetylase [Chloroflexi bacterium RBG_16_57_11]
MKIFFSDHLLVPLPEGHRFPMPKYALLHHAVVTAHLPGVELQPAEPASDDQLLLVHNADYVDKLINGRLSEKELRRIGFPWSPELVVRSRYSVGGTICTCQSALEEGYAANLAGGTHHAYPDHGEGYCVFNDVAVATRVLQVERLASRVVILDLDVHQGNGTAAVFNGDPTVFTFSVHGAKNFPFHKEHSDLDLALPDGSDDDVFLEAVTSGLPRALQRAQADLAIYIAGADPYTEDRLGRLSITKQGLVERDRIVFEQCRAIGLPVAVVMGGGYALEVSDVVDIHLQTIKLAAQMAVSAGN